MNNRNLGKQSIKNSNKKALYKKAFGNIKKTIKVGALSVFALGSLSNVGREVYEEMTSENEIIHLNYGVGSIILSHTEQRKPEQLYVDIEKAVLNIDGLLEASKNPKDLTQQEKEELLLKVVETISSEANIHMKGFKESKFLLERNDGKYNGLYPGFNVSGDFTVSSNNFLLSSSHVQISNFNQLFTTVVHEMIHAVEFQNLVLSGNLSAFEEGLFCANSSLGQLRSYNAEENNHYYSTFIENQAHLIADKITASLYQKAGLYDFSEEEYSYSITQHPSQGYDVTAAPVISTAKAIIYDLKVKPTIKNVLEEFQNSYNIEERVKDTSKISVADFYLWGYQKHLEHYGINYENIDLEDTYYYQMFNYSIPEVVRNQSYEDFINDNYTLDNLLKQKEQQDNEYIPSR